MVYSNYICWVKSWYMWKSKYYEVYENSWRFLWLYVYHVCHLPMKTTPYVYIYIYIYIYIYDHWSLSWSLLLYTHPIIFPWDSPMTFPLKHRRRRGHLGVLEDHLHQHLRVRIWRHRLGPSDRIIGPNHGRISMGENYGYMIYNLFIIIIQPIYDL